jgi:succinate dehydrogenase / fumarate reductase iron-sulfur subunit
MNEVGQEDTFRLAIQRQDGPDQPSYWQHFNVPRKPQMNIISALQHVAADPVTLDGQRVTAPAWDAGCLEEVCGACTMNMNGRVGQACSTLVEPLLKEGEPLVVQPMQKFPVIRDLFVNRQRMFDNLQRIKGWVTIDSTQDLGPGPRESPEAQQERYELSRCMTCGCCLEACPEFQLDNDFVGAQIFVMALYYNQHETGSELKRDRLHTLMEPGGIAQCGNSQNCVEVCPKNIPTTEAIAKIGRQTTVQALKDFFQR